MQPTIRSASALAVLALLSLATVSFPADAFHNPGVPVLDSVSLSGAKYVAWRVSLPNGGTASIEAMVSGQPGANTASAGVWAMTSSLQLRGAAILTSIGGNGATNLLVNLPDPIGSVLKQKSGGTTGGGGIAITFNNLPAGEYVFVSVSVADGPSTGSAAVFAPTGASVVGRTTGDGFLLREPDFKGGVNVYASMPVRNAQQTYKLIEGASVDEEVAGRLFVLYQAFSNSQDIQVSYDNPGGNVPMTCNSVGSFCIATAFIHGAAGDHTFRIDHNFDYYDTLVMCPTLGPCGFPAVIFASGADVAIP